MLPLEELAFHISFSFLFSPIFKRSSSLAVCRSLE